MAKEANDRPDRPREDPGERPATRPCWRRITCPKCGGTNTINFGAPPARSSERRVWWSQLRIEWCSWCGEASTYAPHPTQRVILWYPGLWDDDMGASSSASVEDPPEDV